MKTIACGSLFALIMLLFLVCPALAQTGGVKGTVVDDQTGSTMPGANVFLEKTSYGAAADVDGKFSIGPIPVGEYTLVVSYVGYVQFRLAITIVAEKAQTLDIRLKPSAVQLNPVVVTAIGTQANREQLGTSVSTIEASALNTKGANDIISSIAALAPGVNTIASTGEPGSATRIVLRGQRSFMNNNQPLIVIDGIPIDNSVSVGGGSSTASAWRAVDGVAAFSRISDINPDDIRSMQIYSGPSAASLWGSRAANGVIAITTKSGTQGGTKSMSLTVRSKISSDEVSHLVPLQRSFGQGYGGMYMFNFPLSWGDPIFLRSGNADVTSRSNYPYATITQKNSTVTYDHASEIFRKPISFDYGATLRGGDEWGDFYLDMSKLNQKGIVLANSDFERTSIRGTATRRFAENLLAKFNAAYISSKSDRIQVGNTTAGLMLGAYRTPPDFNNQPYLVDYVDANGNVTPWMQRTYQNGEGNPTRGAGFDNPLYSIYEVPVSIITDRIVGGTEISYDPMTWLNFTYRLGLDYYTDRIKSTNPVGDASAPGGALSRAANSSTAISTDVIGKATQGINDDIEASLMLGLHLDHNKYEGVNVAATGLVVQNAPATFSNALNFTPAEYLTITRSAAVYGELDFSLYKQLFIKFTGRDESASTYGPDAPQTYFYPSASIAWQFTQLPVLKENEILSFGKLRLAYGQAANQPPAYVTRTYYQINNLISNSWGEGLNGQYYNGAAAKSDQLGNSNLKPEMTSEAEIGADLRFFDDRASLSVTYYSNKTTDAILPVNLSPSTGYASKYANAASLENKGTEVQLIAEWLRMGQFSWATTLNWSHNKNIVTDLSGVESVYLNGFGSDPSCRAILNQPYGVIYGSKWARKADGNLNIAANGFPQGSVSLGVNGDPNPNYRMGIINTFRYQRLSLGVLVDIKQGGVMWNGTKGALCYFGTHGSQNWWNTVSAADATNLRNFAGQTLAQLAAGGSKSSVKNPDGTYSFRGYVNDFGGGRVIVDQSWFVQGLGGLYGPSEQWLEDASYVRLREITLSYRLPLQFVGMQSVTFSITGRNLKTWTDYTGNDPEGNVFGPSNGQGIDYYNNPTTKSWIFTIQLSY
jgi:TonB-linked SusC/RagA family outer membrane protein